MLRTRSLSIACLTQRAGRGTICSLAFSVADTATRTLVAVGRYRSTIAVVFNEPLFFVGLLFNFIGSHNRNSFRLLVGRGNLAEVAEDFGATSRRLLGAGIRFEANRGVGVENRCVDIEGCGGEFESTTTTGSVV